MERREGEREGVGRGREKRGGGLVMCVKCVGEGNGEWGGGTKEKSTRFLSTYKYLVKIFLHFKKIIHMQILIVSNILFLFINIDLS